MKKFVIFDEQGFPSSEYPAPPESHVLVDGSLPLRDADGRWLRPDGSYNLNLAGLPAFGGSDGRQPVFVPEGHWGKGWAFFSEMKSAENPYGILREPRGETKAEKAAREKAEADAAAAAEKQRVLALVASSVQFAQACALTGIITRDEAIAWAASGALPQVLANAIAAIPDESARFAAEIKAAGAVTYERASPVVAGLGAALGKSEADLDALFQLAVTL